MQLGYALANDFRCAHDAWILIAPLGDFPAVGNRLIQRIDSTASAQIVNEFASRPTALPWYIGHPDMDRRAYPDDNVYGWISEMANRSDGAYMRVNWTDEGRALKASRKFRYYSPCWNADETGIFANGVPVVRPSRLLSVGFTNNPNIPVPPLPNARRPPPPFDTAEQRREMTLALVNTEMRLHGLGYNDAFLKIQRTHPELLRR